MNIYEKIAEARVRFSSAKIEKSGRNKHLGYEYFELKDIVPAALKICKEIGLTPIVSFGEGTATMTVRSGDEYVEITTPLMYGEMKGCHPMQAMGAVETYARRYLWMALLEIVEPDALDADEYKKPTGQSATDPPRRRESANDSKVPAGTSTAEFRPQSVWSIIVRHFGYSANGSAEANEKAKDRGHEFVEMFGIKELSDITEEIGKKMLDKLAEGGPESFADPEADKVVGI